MQNSELERHANQVRKDIILETHAAQSGHPGGSLGAADLLTSLYFEEMDINEENVGTLIVTVLSSAKGMPVQLYMVY